VNINVKLKNNSNRDEIYEKNNWMPLDCKSNTETTKELNITPVLDKNKMKLSATNKQNDP